MAAAFFDMDRTVLRVNSAALWLAFQRRRGEIGRLQALRAMVWLLRYRFGGIDMETIARRMAAPLAGQSERAMEQSCRLWYRDEVEHTIAAEARTAIDTHRARGERIVLLTTATPYIAGPLADTLGLDHVLCSRMEVEDGRFTGRLVEPLCYGNGKVTLAERWAREQGIDLGASAFYTDSYSDRPMLERVGRPVVINPDPRLSRLARHRGWPVHRWNS